MPLHTPIFLVRHGRDRQDSPELSGAGIQQAEQARDILLQEKLVRRSIILSTRAIRCLATACIVGESLEAPIIQGSSEFTRYGSYPHGLESLDELLESELAAAGHQPDDLLGRTLIAVTNSPLIAVARGLPLPDDAHTLDALVPYGSVTPYTVGSWRPLPSPELAD